MHLYAAAGSAAPRFITGADGVRLIECPSCLAGSAASANRCGTCGLPFSTDGFVGDLPTATGSPADIPALLSLILGVLSIPACCIVFPAVLAIGLGLLALLLPGRSSEWRVRPMAITGIASGIASLIIATVVLLASL